MQLLLYCESWVLSDIWSKKELDRRKHSHQIAPHVYSGLWGLQHKKKIPSQFKKITEKVFVDLSVCLNKILG